MDAPSVYKVLLDLPLTLGCVNVRRWFSAGLIWSEIKQLWDVGLKEYVHDAWNLVDFFTNSLYVATIALRVVSYYRVQEEIALGLKSADYER